MTPRFASRLKRFVRKLCRVDLHYSCESYNLVLPPDHLLPTYQGKYSHYDRFLPHLAKSLPGETLVIDVGANVGDTALAMYFANPSLKFLSFEPDKKLFHYLKKNAIQISRQNIALFPIALSDFETSFTIARGLGTASIKLRSNKSGVSTHTLDMVLTKLSPEFANRKISIIKSDTDGHDAHVLLSGLRAIKKHKPLIFVECLINDPNELKAFDELFIKLASLGYLKSWIFSNVGELIGSTESFESLIPILKSSLERTLESGYGHYVDVLFAPRELMSLASESVLTYS